MRQRGSLNGRYLPTTRLVDGRFLLEALSLSQQPAPLTREIGSRFGGETGCNNVNQANATSFKIIEAYRIGRRS